jgi:hypothetical protein
MFGVSSFVFEVLEVTLSSLRLESSSTYWQYVGLFV